MKSEKTTKSGLSSSGRIPVFKPQFREDLIYRITDDRIYFLQARYHYETR